MRVFVRCERCKQEAAPVWRGGSGAQMNICVEGRWVAPAGWNIVVGYTLCNDCVNEVTAAVHRAVGCAEGAPK